MVWIQLMPREHGIIDSALPGTTPLATLIADIKARIEYGGEVTITTAEYRALAAADGRWQLGYQDQVRALLEAAKRSGN